jgi:hypothetical protein
MTNKEKKGRLPPQYSGGLEPMNFAKSSPSFFQELVTY